MFLYVSGLENEVSRGQVTQKHVFLHVFEAGKQGISRPSDSKACVFTCFRAFFRGDFLKLRVFACFQEAVAIRAFSKALTGPLGAGGRPCPSWGAPSMGAALGIFAFFLLVLKRPLYTQAIRADSGFGAV